MTLTSVSRLALILALLGGACAPPHAVTRVVPDAGADPPDGGSPVPPPRVDAGAVGMGGQGGGPAVDAMPVPPDAPLRDAAPPPVVVDAAPPVDTRPPPLPPPPDAAPDAAADLAPPARPPTAAELMRIVAACREISVGRYRNDEDTAAQVPVCALNGAVFWRADMDINCNGKRTAACNENTDPGFQAETTTRDSLGQFLDAAAVPFVVVPAPGPRFDYRMRGLAPGSAVAVIFGNAVQYGVVGDEGAPDIIGEASAAMARRLGIDDDPATGGSDAVVTYILFTGPNAVLGKAEDHDEAVRVGQARAAQALREN